MTVAVFIVVLANNVGLHPRVRNAGIKTSILIFVASSCECLSLCINGIAFNSILHQLVKAIELSITPLVPIIASCMFYIEDNSDKFKKVVFFFIFCNFIMEFMSCTSTNLVFYIDSGNNFARGNYYFFYIIVNFLSTVFCFSKAFQFCRKFQTKNYILLFSIISFLVMGVSIQFVYPDILASRLTQIISLLLLYIFYNETTMYVDKLTTLLNQSSYQNTLERIDTDELFILIFDVDDFKNINDTYGHGFGDRVLRKIGETLKKCYGEYGKVYRIGGDEFAVIIKKEMSKLQLQQLNSKFSAALDEIRKSLPELPYISYGSAFYTPSSSLREVKEEADRNMYREKANRKQHYH